MERQFNAGGTITGNSHVNELYLKGCYARCYASVRKKAKGWFHSLDLLSPSLEWNPGTAIARNRMPAVRPPAHSERPWLTMPNYTKLAFKLKANHRVSEKNPHNPSKSSKDPKTTIVPINRTSTSSRVASGLNTETPSCPPIFILLYFDFYVHLSVPITPGLAGSTEKLANAAWSATLLEGRRTAARTIAFE